MKSFSIPVLFASAIYVSANNALEVEDPYSDALEAEDPYTYVSILNARDRYVFDSETASTTGCAAQFAALSTCFKFVKEPQGEDCWGCTLWETFPDTCDEYCKDVEYCRNNLCHSGSACTGQYYEVLNCALDDAFCQCDESGHDDTNPKTYLRA
mmetsp:Transcript_17214/g.37156  ORF Transcript_17214/g.37156 Transcript_17214/m.37156 type:complete len:154 (-) Transcript_17214:389-850(-)|eukprot:CAMPEP_0172530246 /NCGR_PEP_ID=MMETSP1067-20121228/4042_1 /TAXON_ID=265564 ORGANISM="Thalassiosira punctigera, Strain Tpunct2005C2" /NCGR_SAMPLE_ID=MMETSP1067 /ASSEMBLY_ACC=CAM_ASM_000444 /LENGTH=153 /DNA_ID=CAMNT_0013314413 /DNA_START=197 /DNA_END=658 /DNA_ORIENTATION=+